MPAKRKRMTYNAKSSGACQKSKIAKDPARDPGNYEVESVLGFKLEKLEPVFNIKWKDYDASYNTWEPLENLVSCTVFRDFIDQKFKSLELDIYVNVVNSKQRQKKRFRQAARMPKYYTMLEVQPFDPFEYKVYQVMFHLVPQNEKFTNVLDDLIFKNHFFLLEQSQRLKMDELLSRINKKEDIKVTIENEEDFSDPPQFEYITKNFLSDEMYVIDHSGVNGCKCITCSKDSGCCPSLKNQPFPYKIDKHNRAVLRLQKVGKIFECGDLCSCGQDCVNRASQKPKEMPLCLFKTSNRGWGVKAVTNIPKGTFILEYVGELIGQAEANARAETAYLFDLNCDMRKDGRFFTIDAFKYGNLSRFVNHSCEPNAKIYFISLCHGDPKNQKICFFASRLIHKGEEITIDYTGGDGGHSEAEEPIGCNCGAEGCRKYIY